MSNRWLKAAVIVVASGALAAVGGFAFLRHAPRQTPPGQPSLTVLHEGDLSPFEEAFNAAAGSTRIVALLSPT